MWSSVLLPDVMDGKDIGMIERSNGARFLLKAMQPLAFSGERLRQNFHRNIAPLPDVAGAIHFAHPTSAQRRLNFIGKPDRCTSLLPCHGRGWVYTSRH
jgi:hypothetical protein